MLWIKRYTISLCLCILTTGCQTDSARLEHMIQSEVKNTINRYGDLGLYRVTYMTNDDVKQDDKYAWALPNSAEKRTYYGALELASNDAEAEPMMVVLQRQNKNFVAETKFYQSNNSRMYFALGMNYEEKAPIIGVRMEF